MPSFNVTLEDTSPMIRYSPDWQTGLSTDPFADKYSEKTFTLTSQPGASVQFLYYGTNITVFGAHRPNHGTYTARLDDGPVFSASSAGVEAFMQVLYSGNATLGMHTVTVTNQDSFFDLDYLTFSTSVGKDGDNLIVNTYQDDHPSFVYTPAAAWITTSDKVSWFSGSNGHFTTQPSAVATLTFEGDAVAVYGPVGPSGGAYSVQVDNASPLQYTTNTTSIFKVNEVLFFAGNLGAGNHSVRIQTGSSSGEFAIDYVDVYSSTSLGGSFIGQPSGRITVQSHSETKPTGLIAGLVITSIIALIATLISIYLVWRLRRSNDPEIETRPEVTPFVKSNEAMRSTTLQGYPVSASQHTDPSSSAASGVPYGPTSKLTPLRPSGYTPQGKLHEAYPPHYTEG
ncbi:hypothetical protein CPC08DRAFT_702581 [Agrocybe pediades]|nr:hypothetical protein CPC08DRAFT_702581 [Agrocybe pediades]